MTQVFKWIETIRTNGHGPANKEKFVAVGVISAGRESAQLSVRVYSPAMLKMRWVCGDRMKVGFDETGMRIAIQRVPTGGFAASPSGSTKKDRKDNIGKHAASYIKMSLPADMAGVIGDTIYIDEENCEDQNGCLIVSLT